MESNPTEILTLAHLRASQAERIISNPEILKKLNYICRESHNRSGVRVILACSLAKIHNPSIDIRKPYTEIGDEDVYSGRRYDESYITAFIDEHNLPCNNTTAWLTPAWRNHENELTPAVIPVGTPRKMYRYVIELLDSVHSTDISAEDLLAQTVQILLDERDERQQEMDRLIKQLSDRDSDDLIPLSTEDIVTLIEQHLRSKNSSRLPVLAVAAAYNAAQEYLHEKILPLESHNAADKQTGSLGDLEVTMLDDDGVITSYEMKARRVTENDISHALTKINETGKRIDNYIFITTDIIDIEVLDYARSLYEKTGGIEFVILDCVSFVRYFLHLFHRIRLHYLDAYQKLLMEEPDSAVSDALKRVFLDLRINAEESLHKE